MRDKPIALVDLDGTLVDHEGTLLRDLKLMQSPKEPNPELWNRKNRPAYIKARIDRICASKDWWANLPWLETGKELLNLFIDMDFRVVILTAGSKKNPDCWSGKMEWCLRNLPSNADIDVTITRDKGLVYGKVLADDYPKYIKAWIKHRPRGQVIMPAHPYNAKFRNRQVFRCDGSQSSLCEARKILQRIKDNYKGES